MRPVLSSLEAFEIQRVIEFIVDLQALLKIALTNS